ncbi:unnamed protein product [Closterium sp. NIES-64]|nr:unnamed protein product [Closterium sp. NIES-64]
MTSKWGSIGPLTPLAIRAAAIQPSVTARGVCGDVSPWGGGGGMGGGMAHAPGLGKAVAGGLWGEMGNRLGQGTGKGAWVHDGGMAHTSGLGKAVAGGSVGAWPMPLDWEKPWQVGVWGKWEAMWVRVQGEAMWHDGCMGAWPMPLSQEQP